VREAAPFEGARATARDVGDVAVSAGRVVLVSVLALASVLLVTRTLARRRRRYRRFRIVPHRGSEAAPERVQQLLESWHQQLLPRWWRRVAFGQASVALEVQASETGGADGRIELLLQCPDGAVGALQGALRACYPDARPVETKGEIEHPRRVIRVKKRFEFILRLRTAGDSGSCLMDAALTQMAALERPTALQYVLTPAPALFERLSRMLFRASEVRLERARLRDRGDPGLRSGVAGQELKGGLAVQHRRLFFTELRVGGPSYAACRALAGTLRGESAAENQLVERYMRPYGSGPLHARRMQRGLADPLPSWRRGVLSSSELAALWQLPSPALRLPGLVRSPLPRAQAPTGVSRAPEHALLHDERGPVGIRPGDRTAGLGLIGGQGTGKTAAMCRTVASDALDRDCALIVLDPKSDLADKALSVIPPERSVHYLDFEAPEIGINPLLAPGDPAMVADKVVEAFKDIHEDGDIRASSDRFLRQAAHAAIGASRLGAIEEEPNLWHMYRLLLPSEEEFRERIVRAIEPKPTFVETAIFFGRDLPDDLRAAPALAPDGQLEPDLTPLVAGEPERDRNGVGLQPRRRRQMELHPRCATAGLDRHGRAYLLSLERTFAFESEHAVEREWRRSYQPDGDEQHERRRERGELGAARGERRDERDRGERRICLQPRRGRQGHRASSGTRTGGTGQLSRQSRTTSSALMRWIHSSGRSVIRCASAGTAIRLTSSGVTKSRPSSPAFARASLSSASVPRGLAPTWTWALSRVAVTRSTA
jgi:hypothetical protein